MTGSRAATGYRVHVTGEMAAGLAELGWLIVSGDAYGIDAAAHRGALTAGGTTIAVLASGTPPANGSRYDAASSPRSPPPPASCNQPPPASRSPPLDTRRT